MCTDSHVCHELVRSEVGRCDIAVLCSVGQFEGAQLDRDDRDEDAEGGQEGKEAQEPMRLEPTKEEVRAHRVSHLPCREWCHECVAGRAKNWPHRSRNSQETLTVSEARCT